LVSAGVMRVSASMPSVSVRFEASMRGCAAIARIGRNSSHSVGIVEPAVVPCSGIERQALAHCDPRVLLEGRIVAHARLHQRDLLGDILVDQRLHLRGHVDARARHAEARVVEIDLRVRLGSMRQFAAIFGRADMTTLPLISALALRFLMFTLPICLATVAAEQAAERLADRTRRLRRQRAR
jgi:hypothetical protein